MLIKIFFLLVIIIIIVKIIKLIFSTLCEIYLFDLNENKLCKLAWSFSDGSMTNEQCNCIAGGLAEFQSV